MGRFGRAGVLAVGLGVVLLIIGVAVSNDLLGFLFMLCLVAGAALVVTDFVVRRRARGSV